MIDNLESILKEAAVIYWKYYFESCLERLKKIKKNRSKTRSGRNPRSPQNTGPEQYHNASALDFLFLLLVCQQWKC